jgi:hypothetical protein
VTEWATRRRRAEQVTGQHLWKVPSARTIARMLTTGRDHLTKSETVMVKTIETGVPALDVGFCRKLLERPQKRLSLGTLMQREQRIAEMPIGHWLRIAACGSCGPSENKKALDLPKERSS